MSEEVANKKEKIKVAGNSGENVFVTGRKLHSPYPVTPTIRVKMKAPDVDKIDGRARILRPLRPIMQSTSRNLPTPSTSNTTTPAKATTSSGGSMHHSASMPALQSAVRSQNATTITPSSGRPMHTLPSNTTEKNVVALLPWAESLKARVEKMRQKSRGTMILTQHASQLNPTESAELRKMLLEIVQSFNEITRASNVKCRYNTIFDKRWMMRTADTSLTDLKFRDARKVREYEKLQGVLDEKSAIDKNVSALSDSIRINPPPPSRFRMTRPPVLKFRKHVEESTKSVWLAMETLMNKTQGSMMTWRFKRISHPFFRNSKCLLEVRYTARRQSGEREFVPTMKAIIVLKNGNLEDLVIGADEEDLYDQERILSSKRNVYQEFTRSAKEIILCSAVTKFTSPNNFAQVNNYIQSYVNCFSTKCFYCKKYLCRWLPPTFVTREGAVIAHRSCLQSQVPS